MSTESPSKLPSFFSLACSDGVPGTAIIVAVIVGSVLNLINQGDVLFGEGSVNLAKIVLTYIVPYCVSTCASVSMKIRMLRRHSTAQNSPL